MDDHRDTVSYFDIDEQMMPGCTVVIVGKRCSGKSVMLFDILSHMKEWFNYGMAFTPTQSSRKFFSKCMPEMLIDRPSPERLEHFVRTINEEYDQACESGIKPRTAFLVCDDCAFDDQFMRCKTLQEVFLNGRQFNTTCIMVAQYLKKFSPSLRGNADFVFVAYDGNQKAQDMIWEFWFNMMPKKVFKEVFKACTLDFGYLVMDVRKSATSRDWHECVYWYKAEVNLPPFTLCDSDFFRLADHCRARDSANRQIKQASRDKVWRLGPDGNVFDAPSCVARRTKEKEEFEEYSDDDE